MNRKIIVLVIAPILTILMISCDDFIALDPHDSVNVDALYQTDSDFQDAITGIYAALQDRYGWMYIFGDIRGDDAWREVVRGVAAVRSNDFTMDDTEGLLNSTWSGYYQVIYRANEVLSKIEDEDIDASGINNRDRHIGEARFLRALSYFDLVRIFGDVPMIITPITVEESYTIAREPIDNIYDGVIIPDLMDAVDRLPETYTGSNVGRATKGAAMALLGRVYLTLNDFVNAENTLLEVTTMGYDLLEDYNDLWDYSADEHHSEYIFDIEYISGGVGQGSRVTYQTIPTAIEFAQKHGIFGGSGGEDLQPTQVLVELFENSPGDLRKDVTVDARGGWINEEGEFVPFIQAATITRKYLAPAPTPNDSPANWKVIRYADVLLMLAEAMNENNKTEVALTYLNLVRARAGVEEYSGLTQEDARERIYRERRLELSFEGHRWFDLVRTGRALEVMEPHGMRSHNIIFPIPLPQLQVINNTEVLWQNPGY